MAVAPQLCSKEDGCCLNTRNRQTVLDVNCKLNELLHLVRCCSGRMKGGESCISAEGVSAEEMRKTVTVLEETVRLLKTEVKSHGEQHQLREFESRGEHQLREHKGRNVPDRDSAYLSSNLNSVDLSREPIQEEGIGEDGVAPLPPTAAPREPTENSLVDSEIVTNIPL